MSKLREAWEAEKATLLNSISTQLKEMQDRPSVSVADLAKLTLQLETLQTELTALKAAKPPAPGPEPEPEPEPPLPRKLTLAERLSGKHAANPPEAREPRRKLTRL